MCFSVGIRNTKDKWGDCMYDVNDKWGLVFAGGGGKGAYQIGAWKALNKLCKDLNICAVAGTSVGALNAVLYAIGDYNLASRIWNDEQLAKDILRLKSLEEVIDDSFLSVLVSRLEMLDNGKLDIFLDVVNELMNKGVLSREGLREIIIKNNIVGKMRQVKIPCYATICSSLNPFNMRAVYKDLRNLEHEEFIKILLASSAIPFIFSQERVKGKLYCDGGIIDNAPTQAIHENCSEIKNIIVIDLAAGNSKIDRYKYEDVTILHLRPKQSLKGFRGTLDFGKETIEALMKQGEEETEKNLAELGLLTALQTKKGKEAIDQRLKEHKDCFQDAWSKMGHGFYSNKPDEMIRGANQITRHYGGEVPFENIEELKQLF